MKAGLVLLPQLIGKSWQKIKHQFAIKLTSKKLWSLQQKWMAKIKNPTKWRKGDIWTPWVSGQNEGTFQKREYKIFLQRGQVHLPPEILFPKLKAVSIQIFIKDTYLIRIVTHQTGLIHCHHSLLEMIWRHLRQFLWRETKWVFLFQTGLSTDIQRQNPPMQRNGAIYLWGVGVTLQMVIFASLLECLNLMVSIPYHIIYGSVGVKNKILSNVMFSSISNVDRMLPQDFKSSVITLKFNTCWQYHYHVKNVPIIRKINLQLVVAGRRYGFWDQLCLQMSKLDWC